MNALRAVSLETVTPFQKGLITFVVVMSSLLQLLDVTVVNVAIPHMQGQLSATSEQISWVLTSYVVATSIFMPLTGFFTDRLGVRTFLLISIAGFTLTSLLCGLATTLEELVIFRIFQGIFGAGLLPLSQAVLIRMHTPEERGQAIALWGMGIMVGPILGPTLGGWLTENWSWHWTFFINVPLGILLIALAWPVIPQTDSRPRKMDWSGFVLMAFALASMQMVLDLGQHNDWFQSNLIRVLLLLAVVSFAGFLWHGLSQQEDPIFDLRMFRDRNFCAGLMVTCSLSLGMFGSMLLIPLMLVNTLGFSVLIAGLLQAPRGLATLISTILAGRLIKVIDPRLVMAAGILINIAGTYPMIHYNLDTTWAQIMIPGMVQGFGMGMIFVPGSTLAYSTLAPRLMTEATGVYNLIRSVGGSIGIAILASFYVHQAQTAWGQLRGGVGESSAVLQDWASITGFDGFQPEMWGVLAMQLERHSHMVAFVDGFTLTVFIFMGMLPLLLLFKPRGREVSVENARLEGVSAT